MVWAVVWGARAATESLEMQQILRISMVWGVLWGARWAAESLEIGNV